MSVKVVCAGSVVLDRIYELATLPMAPGKYIARGYREAGGGMAATAAVAVAALGGRAIYCGRTGADDTGAALCGMLRRLGVDTAGVTMAEGARTPSAGVTLDPEGERILTVFPGANLPEDAPLGPELVEGAGAVLGDPRWVSGVERLFDMGRARGLARVLDADIAPGEILRRLAPQADHVLFSQRGLVDFAGTEDPEAGLAAAAAQLSGVVAVTLGPKGSLWWRDGAPRHLPAPRIAARDTTGCGDVFHGIYALAIAEGAPVEQAARMATAAAALKAVHGNGWDGMPDRAAVEALLREGWE